MARLQFLVIDSNSFMRNEMRKNVSRHFQNSDVFDVPDGKKALNYLKQHRVNLILCDEELSDQTGLELLTSLRGDSNFSSIPFIMLSSPDDKQAVVQTIEAGANEVIYKPFRPSDIEQKVSKILLKKGLIKKKASTNSLDILTGGSSNPDKGTNAPSAKKPKRTSETSKVLPQVKIAVGELIFSAAIKDLSADKITVITRTPSSIPALLTTATTQFPQKEGGSFQVTGFISALRAIENKPQTATVGITITLGQENSPEAFKKLLALVPR